MSESKAKKKRTRRFLDERPFCYFCGGARPAITVDHVRPRACFPDGFAPEGFESPACKACNQGADKQDQIFELYAMMLDFDPARYFVVFYFVRVEFVGDVTLDPVLSACVLTLTTRGPRPISARFSPDSRRK